MRVALFLVLLIFLVSALLLCWSVELSGSSWEQAVPADVLALAVIDRPESNLDLLFRGSLGDWLRDSVGSDVQAVEGLVRARLEGLGTVRMRRVALLLHQLEHRQRGTFKIHFSLLLEPEPSGQSRIQQQMDYLAGRLFSSDEFEVEGHAQTLVYRGPEPRQILYYRQLGRSHLVSNSQTGWDQVILTWTSNLPRLSQRKEFIETRSNLPGTEGVLVFCDLSRIISLLPKFGYWIGERNGTVSEKFHLIE